MLTTVQNNVIAKNICYEIYLEEHSLIKILPIIRNIRRHINVFATLLNKRNISYEKGIWLKGSKLIEAEWRIYASVN